MSYCGGDTLTIFGNGVTVTAALIQATSGNACIVNAGTPQLNFGASFSGDFVTNSSTLLINCQVIFGNITENDSGNIVLNCLQEPSGTLTGNISINAQVLHAPVVSGNLPMFSGTLGGLSDSGVPAVPSTFYAVIPWTSWQYFVAGGGGGDFYWCPSDSQNGGGFVGPSNRDFGSVSFTAPVAGNYQFTVQFRTGTSEGIATFTIDGTPTLVDTYTSGETIAAWVWQQELAAGTYEIDLTSLTKNDSSTDYWLTPLYDGLTIALLPS